MEPIYPVYLDIRESSHVDVQSVRKWMQEAQAQASRTLLSYVGAPQGEGGGSGGGGVGGLSFSYRIMSMREVLASSQHKKRQTDVAVVDDAKIKILKVIGRGSVSGGERTFIGEGDLEN